MTVPLPPPRLVLLTLGGAQDPAGPALLPAVAERLSRLWGVPLRALPAAASGPALEALNLDPGPWLAPLPLDPGLGLNGGSWAEALGAWRQPCLLVMDASRLSTGLPAAATALLERWGVPLAGLIQWEGQWDQDSRRGDGLPWLGRLGAAGASGSTRWPEQPQPEQPQREAPSAPAPDPGDEEAALLLRLRLRWQQLVTNLA